MDFSKENLIKAAIVGGVAIAAMKFTASKGKMLQGVATISAVALAMPFAAKIGASA